MSAGGLSYSGLTTYGKVTLPSVSNWGTNTNIIRDPPKSIHTRRIDKVGDTNDITKSIDTSGDRVCEYIRQYPLGVNPMVGVSYSNYGNNGGVVGNSTNTSANYQAKLPYRIWYVFRPPLLRQENLLPLSRLPRNVTSQTTNICNIDYTKKLESPGGDYRQIQKDIIHTSVRPTAVYNCETPLKEPFEVKYVIQNPIKVSANSGIKTMDLTQQNVLIPTKEIGDHITYGVGTNVDFQGLYKDNEITRLNPSNKAIGDHITYGVGTNVDFQGLYKNNEINNIDTSRYTQDISHISGTSLVTPLSDIEQVTYIHNDLVLENKLPHYSTTSNKIVYIHFPYFCSILTKNIF